MTNSGILLSRQFWNRKVRTIVLFIIAISFFGFLDSGYLTLKHYDNTPIVCSIFDGCDEVANSKYSEIFDIPLSIFGVVFYLIIFFFSLYYFVSQKNKIINFIFILSAGAFLASFYFVYLQAFAIKAFCFYCILSAISSTALVILSFWLRIQIKNEKNQIK